MKKRFNYSTLALSVCLSLGSTVTFAAEKDTSAGAEHADIERIVSVGTRISNRCLLYTSDAADE